MKGMFGKPAPLAFSTKFGKADERAGTSVAVARAMARRTVMLAEAADVLAVMPQPGQSVHAIMTGRYDLMMVVTLLLSRRACVNLRLATLSYNGRNLDEMVDALDNGRAGKLTLLCSAFFRRHNRWLWEETRRELRARGQRCAAARTHCKVITLDYDGGACLTLEGSANLRTNSNRENLTLVNDRAVHDFHANWIDELITQHEGAE